MDVIESVTDTLRLDLKAASGELLAALRKSSDVANGGTGDELSDRLEWLVHALDGDTDAPTTDMPARDRSVTQSLLRRLRSEVVDQWSSGASPPPATEMLPVLQAFERLEDALAPEADSERPGAVHELPAFDLVTELAHDLRSPLTSILFMAETLWRGRSGDLTDIQHRQVGLIYSAALGLIGLIGDMIEYAHGGEVLAEAEREKFSVNEVFESVCRIVQPSAEEWGLDIRTCPPEHDHRHGHRISLSRVLMNLTQNALKFTDEGFVEIAAREIGDGRDRVEFSVSDTGPGIGDEALETLYEPIRRSKARDSGYYFSGTALGLSICRKLVDAMGSELHVETRPGRGTRFSFELHLPAVDYR